MELSTAAGATNAEGLLHRARDSDRAGSLTEAITHYEAALALAEASGQLPILAEVLRRLAVVRHRQQESDAAWALSQRSYEIATSIGSRRLTAEALNTLAAFALDHGDHNLAREYFFAALCSAGDDIALRARVEQNLGIISTIQGNPASALEHYNRAVEAFSAAGDEEGLAGTYHNLAMVNVDLHQLEPAIRYFSESQSLAERLRDHRLSALCFLNQTEIFILQDRLVDASASVNQAIQLFDALGDRSGKGAAYRFLGIIHRLTGRPVLAQARLEDAIALARTSGAPLEEAEASHELALVYRDRGDNREALSLLNAARRLFGHLDARQELGDIASKVAELEASYLAVVREWGQSIESSDNYTYGHSERVATYAVAVARQLGLDQSDQMAVRVGAYLHDVGKVRIPPEILQKTGPLTDAEFAVMKQHPMLGVELLAAVAFPWDIIPMIRSHHEKWDGSGYPDGLRGAEIPLAAQIIGVADVYDALTTTRPYRPARSREQAIGEMEAHRAWWNPEMLGAFLLSLKNDPAHRSGPLLPGTGLASLPRLPGLRH